MNILTNNKLFLALCFLVLVFLFESRLYSQEANNVETVTEIVPPLKTVLPDNEKINLDQDKEIRSFLNELDNSDTKAINFSTTSNFTSDIIYDQDNITNSINIFNDNDTNKLLDELSNNNVLLFKNEENLEKNTSTNSNINFSTKVIENTRNDNNSYNSPIVDKSELEKVKLSSIGLDYDEFLSENLDIWSDIDFERAIFLLDNINYDLDSYVLKEIIKKLLTVSQDPPKGEIVLENKFINKKLNLLANLNGFESLYELIDLLPKGEDFDSWRALRVQHYFLKGAFETDNSACDIVDSVSLTNSDSFWKKALIFCQIIQGNEDDALFDAGLLKASGNEDTNFFNLLNSLTQKGEDFILDDGSLGLLHIAMMDQIRNIIPSDYIFKIPKYNYSVLLNVENIQPDSKTFIVDELINNKSISLNEIKKYYNVFGDNSLKIEEALNNLRVNNGPQSRADIWNSIKNNSEKDINKSILEAISIESKSGRSIQSMSLLSEFFIFSDNNSNKYENDARKIKLINDIYYEMPLLENLDEDEKFLLNLLSLSPGQNLKIDRFIQYKILDIIPLLKLFNINVFGENYLELYLNQVNSQNSYENNIFLELALNKSLEDKQFLEAITIKSLMLKDTKLHQLSAKTIYDITYSLISFGMLDHAKDLVREWLISRFISTITLSKLAYKE